MALQTSGQVVKGSLPGYSSGSAPVFSQDQFGGILVSELNARYANLGLTGAIFGAQYAAAATAAASATAVGAFGLFNPAGSGKNLVLLDAVVSITTVAAATTVLQAGFQAIPNQTPTTQTATTVITNAFVGSSVTSVAKALTAGTVVGAPTATFRTVGSFYLDLAAGDIVTSIKDQIDGEIIIAPNSTLSLVSIANTPTVSLSLTWAEVAI
jgi:hypothetical protein